MPNAPRPCKPPWRGTLGKCTRRYWEPEDSNFSSNRKYYSVDKMLEAAEKKPKTNIDISELDWVLKYVNIDDEKRIKKANPTSPVLVTKYRGKLLVTDGVHRLIKAKRKGLKSLPAKILTAEDMAKAEIKQTRKDAYSWGRLEATTSVQHSFSISDVIFVKSANFC